MISTTITYKIAYKSFIININFMRCAIPTSGRFVNCILYIFCHTHTFGLEPKSAELTVQCTTSYTTCAICYHIIQYDGILLHGSLLNHIPPEYVYRLQDLNLRIPTERDLKSRAFSKLRQTGSLYKYYIGIILYICFVKKIIFMLLTL